MPLNSKLFVKNYFVSEYVRSIESSNNFYFLFTMSFKTMNIYPSCPSRTFLKELCTSTYANKNKMEGPIFTVERYEKLNNFYVKHCKDFIHKSNQINM